MTVVAVAEAEERERAVRALLERQILTPGDPELALARRHREALVGELRDHLGATLTVTVDTAHLAKQVTLAGARPLRLAPRSASERARPIDERRALGARGCLAVCLIAAVLERRSWTQVPLGALAEDVLVHARSLGIELDWRSRADRTALTDGIEFLVGRGVLALRAGQAGRLDSDDEAFYDVHRRRLALLLCDPVVTAEADRPAALQRSQELGGDLAGRARARRLIRALVEDPVVYLDDLDEDDRAYFVAQRQRLETIAQRITGLAVERRREGTALVARGRELTDRPFPARGHVKQLALLLLPELCDRVTPAGPDEQRTLISRLVRRHHEHWPTWDADDPASVERARTASFDVLVDLCLAQVDEVDGAVCALPLAHRYRAATASRTGAGQMELA